MTPKDTVFFVTEAAAALVGSNLATAVRFAKSGDLTGALRNIGWAQDRLTVLEAAIRGERFAHGERD